MELNLLPPSVFSEQAVRAAALKHGLLSEPLSLFPRSGMMNEIWMLGDAYVLRAPLEKDSEQYLRREAAAVPLAISTAVETPELLVFDEDRDVLPVAFTIYRRAPGVLLARLTPDASALPAVRELSRQLGTLHLGVPQTDSNASLLPDLEPVDFSYIGECADTFPSDEAAILHRWIDKLSPVPADPTRCLVHDDAHPWNVLVDPASYEFSSLLDWGDAGWGDPARDLSRYPLWMLPSHVEAYRDHTGNHDELFIPRMLSMWLETAMWEATKLEASEFERTWWRWPIGGVAEVVRFFDTAPPEWRRWGP